MASAASIDTPASPEECFRGSIRYVVSPLVRVRKESFGLLFYNTKDTRLTFVKSRDLLQVLSLANGEKLITASPGSAAQVKVKKLLDDLVVKGLIVKS
jgi:putative mycofactocin binding protein MftB